jgi:hypothetical protein
LHVGCQAYRLSKGGEKDFGPEAVETLMRFMNEPPGKAPIMVFAGYPADMDAFMQTNAGMPRRVPHTFEFEDYSVGELGRILAEMTRSKGFSLEPALTTHNCRALAQLIEEKTPAEARPKMNGGLCERLFEFARMELDKEMDLSSPTVELCERHLLVASAHVKVPPGADKEQRAPLPSAGVASSGGGAHGGLFASIDAIEGLKPELRRGEAGAVEKLCVAARPDRSACTAQPDRSPPPRESPR